jgi:dihydrofolate reductase
MSKAGQVTVTMFLTLDGVAQGPGAPDEDRGGGFDQGGWVVPYLDDEMLGIVNDVVGRAEALLLGRKTYESFASHWPLVTDPADTIAAALNRMPKYVVSRTLNRLEWKGSALLRGDLAQEVAELKRRHGGEIQVHGSIELARALFAGDLVDACHLYTFPVVLGRGRRLFEPGAAPAALGLLGTRTTSQGLVVSSYRRVGKPAYGAYGLETVQTEGGSRAG